MATVKISALPTLAQNDVDAANDVLAIVDSNAGVTKKVSAKGLVGKSVDDLAVTWNDISTTFRAIKLNVTDTASAAGSYLADLQVSGTTKFNVDKDGDVFVSGVTKFGTVGTGTSGVVSIGGGTPAAFEKLSINSLLPSDSNVTIAVSNGGTCPSSTTTSYSMFSTFATTQNAAFTLSSLFHYAATVGAITGGSRTPPTNQYGFYAASNLVGATNNYGFLHAIPAASGRWGFYGEGTAFNHFTGATTFGTAFGYGTTSGVGGTVTQTTSRTTGVTLDKICGEITLVAGTLSGHEADAFVLSNYWIGANDVVIVNIKSGVAAGTANYYTVNVVGVSAGSCTITVGNNDNGTIPTTGTDSPVLQFAVIKATKA